MAKRPEKFLPKHRRADQKKNLNNSKFEEQEHPRDPAGKFTAGAGGSRKSLAPSQVPFEKKQLTPDPKGPYASVAGQSWFTQKPGKELTHEEIHQVHQVAIKEIEDVVQPALDRFQETLESEGIHVKVKSRPKDPKSLGEKMKSKWGELSISSATDLVGSRMIFPSVEDLDQARDRIPQIMGMEVIEDEDFLEAGKPGGYRGEHLLLKSPTGIVFEVQLRTEKQNKFADYAHRIYKSYGGFEDLTRDQQWDARAYSTQLGDWIHELEKGNDQAPKPAAPEWIKEKGLEF